MQCTNIRKHNTLEGYEAFDKLGAYDKFNAQNKNDDTTLNKHKDRGLILPYI